MKFTFTYTNIFLILLAVFYVFIILYNILGNTIEGMDTNEDETSGEQESDDIIDDGTPILTPEEKKSKKNKTSKDKIESTKNATNTKDSTTTTNTK